MARVVQEDGGLVARSLLDPPRTQSAPEVSSGAIVRVSDEGQVELVAGGDTALARLYQLLGRQGIAPCHPAQVMAEVQVIEANPGFDDPALVDRRDLAFVTIDNEDSRDLDQALFVERLSEGFRVYYALADASYYVRPGTALMEEALLRGTTYYLPGMCAPMLPPALSEGLVSLNEDVDRRALLFVLELDAEGRSTRTLLERALVRSRAKLCYDGVQAYHDAPGSSPIAGQEYTESLDLLRVVGELRIGLSRQRGVVEYNRTELSVGLSECKTRFEVGVRERNDVERWNEQVSLLCNMEGADLLEEGGALEHVQAVFRVHPPPLHKRLGELTDTIHALVKLHRLKAAWGWRRGEEELGDYLKRLEALGGHARVLSTIRRQVRYSNRASEFQAESGRHHALGVDGYARFSAPMREVVGIFTHKEGIETLTGRTSDPSQDEVLRERAIEIANEAKRRQRVLTKEAHKMAIDQLLSDELSLAFDERPQRVGTVFGLASSRLYVALDTFPIEIKVYRRDLEATHGCRYAANREQTSMGPKGEGPTFRIGDEVLLRTRDYDEERRQWAFEARVVS